MVAQPKSALAAGLGVAASKNSLSILTTKILDAMLNVSSEFRGKELGVNGCSTHERMRLPKLTIAIDFVAGFWLRRTHVN